MLVKGALYIQQITRVLAYPDANRQFAIATDASVSAIGNILEQAGGNGCMRAIASGNWSLHSHDWNGQNHNRGPFY